MNEKTFRTQIDKLLEKYRLIWVYTDIDTYLITGYEINGEYVILYNNNRVIENFPLKEINSIEGAR